MVPSKKIDRKKKQEKNNYLPNIYSSQYNAPKINDYVSEGY